MSSTVTSLGATTKLNLAEQCISVSLTDHNRQLANAAVELHLVGNDGSGERWQTDQDFRERAEMGYRAELAVSQYYGLDPTIDYRPPRVGDSGHDFRAVVNDETITIDVKATRTVPPELYVTQKRAYHDRYTVPDAYLLCSTELSNGDNIHIVGWCRAEDVIERGEDTTSYGNPVWRLDGLDLSPPPAQSDIESLPKVQRELWAAADRADVDVTTADIQQCKSALLDG